MSAIHSLLDRRSFLRVTRNGEGRSLTLKKYCMKELTIREGRFPKALLWRQYRRKHEGCGRLYCWPQDFHFTYDICQGKWKVLNSLESIFLPALCVQLQKEKTWHLEIQGRTRKKMAIKKKNICNEMPRLMDIVRKYLICVSSVS